MPTFVSALFAHFNSHFNSRARKSGRSDVKRLEIGSFDTSNIRARPNGRNINGIRRCVFVCLCYPSMSLLVEAAMVGWLRGLFAHIYVGRCLRRSVTTSESSSHRCCCEYLHMDSAQIDTGLVKYIASGSRHKYHRPERQNNPFSDFSCYSTWIRTHFLFHSGVKSDKDDLLLWQKSNKLRMN